MVRVLQSTYLIDRVKSLRDAKLAVSNGEYVGIVLNMEIVGLTKVVSAIKALVAARQVPILVLTVHQNEADIVTMFQSGADECLPLTVNGAELLARTKALVRRHGNQPPADARASTAPDIVVGPLRIIPATRMVILDGLPLELSGREFDLLLALARRPGHVFDRLDLQKALWGAHNYGKFSVNTYVTRLRRKLGEMTETPRFLHTVYGVGLKLDVPNGSQAGSRR